LTWLWLWEH